MSYFLLCGKVALFVLARGNELTTHTHTPASLRYRNAFVFLSTSADFLNLCYTAVSLLLSRSLSSSSFLVVAGNRMFQIWEDVIITHPQGSGKACPENVAERRDCVKDCP